MEDSLRKKTIQGIFWSSIERFSVQIVNFMMGLIIARLLSPKEYGIVAMLAIFLSISQVFIDSGFGSALIRKTDRTESDLSTVFYFNIFIGCIAYLVLYCTAPQIAGFYETPILVSVTRVVGINLIINSFCAIPQILLTVKFDFKTQAKISFSSALISGLVGIVLAYRGFGVWALVMQGLTVSIVRIILLWFFSMWKPIASFSKQSFEELFSFGSRLLVSAMLDTAYNNMYSLVVGKLFNVTSLGLYSRAVQFSQFPSSNITGVIQRVTFPVLSSIQNEEDRLGSSYRKIIRLSGFIIFPMMICLAAIAKPLVEVLLTGKWTGMVIYLQIICFAMMWYPIHAINLNLLQVKGRSDLFLRLEVIKKIIGIAILCFTIPMGLKALCWGMALTSIVCLIINTYYTGKLIKLGFIRQMVDLLPTFVTSLAMGGIVIVVLPFFERAWLQLIAGLSVSLFFYLTIVCLFRFREFEYIKEIIQKR